MTSESPRKITLPPNTELLLGPNLDSKLITHGEELQVEVISSKEGWDEITVSPVNGKKGPSGTFYTPSRPET